MVAADGAAVGASITQLMTTETTTHAFGIESSTVDRITAYLRHTGAVAALATFTMGYALLLTIAVQFFAEWGLVAEASLPLLVAIETTLTTPIIVSMALAARYIVGVLADAQQANWTSVALMAAGAAWMLIPPLVVIWPQAGLIGLV